MWTSRASWRTRYAAPILAFTLVSALLGSMGVSPAEASTGNPGTLSPSTLGQRPNGGFLNADRLAKAEQELDARINWYVAMAGRQSPADMKGSVHGQLISGRAVLPTVADRMNLVMTVPLAFGKQTARTADGRADIRSRLLATARGDWDADFRHVAENLVAGGYPDAVIRLGHEFTGGWYPWSAQGNADAYIAAYRHVHEVLRSVSPDFTFEWNAARNTFIEYGPPAYPGDAYVDIVGLDVYYEPWKGDKALTDDYWNRRYQRVLEAHQQFAAERGKPVSYAEWGNGGVDEPAFIEAMHGWFSSLPASGPGSLLYHSYFNVSKDLYNLDVYPRSKEAYLRLFGGSGDVSAKRPSTLVTDSSPAANDPASAPETLVVRSAEPEPDTLQISLSNDAEPRSEAAPEAVSTLPVSSRASADTVTQFSMYDQSLVHRATEYATTDFSAPADWREPVNFIDGKTYVRLNITDKPSDKPVQLISCMWRDRYKQEKCLGLGTFEDSGLHYFEFKSPDRWWKANQWSWDRPIEFVRILAKDPATGRLFTSARCGSVCYPGDDLDEHTPIAFEAELIVVAAGADLNVPSDWVGCPSDWGGICGDSDSTPPPSSNPQPPAPTPPPPVDSTNNPRLDLPESASAERGVWTTLAADTDADEVVWWRHRGPGSVSWRDKRAVEPSLRFHAAGTYVLAVRARSDAGTTRSFITVEVTDPNTSQATTAVPAPTPEPTPPVPAPTVPAPTTVPTLSQEPPASLPEPSSHPPIASIRDSSAAEGAPLVFKIVLDRTSDHDVSIVVETSDVTAEAGVDYIARRESLIIPAGERRAWLGVPTVSDGQTEPVEKVRLRIVEISGAGVGDNGIGTIT